MITDEIDALLQYEKTYEYYDDVCAIYRRGKHLRLVYRNPQAQHGFTEVHMGSYWYFSVSPKINEDFLTYEVVEFIKERAEHEESHLPP